MTRQDAQSAIYQLERVLDSSAEKSDVVDALAAASAACPTLPPFLKFRAEERIAAESMVQRRRILFGIGCMLVMFASIVGGFGLATLNQKRSSQQNQRMVQRLIEAEQWEEADALIRSLEPSDLASPGIADAKSLVQDALQAEQDRIAEFKKVAATLRASTGSLDPSLVERLDELARSEQERELVIEVSAKLDEQRLIRDATKIDNQTSVFEGLQEEVAVFLNQQSASLDPDQRQARSEQLRKELQQLVSKFQFSNPDLAQAAKQTVAMLSRDSKLDQAEAKEQAYLDAITEAVGDMSAYTRQFDRLSDLLPESPSAIEFAKNEGQIKSRQATQAWLSVLSDPSFTQPQAVDDEQAVAWLQLFDRASALEPGHPFAEAAQPWRAHYQAIARRPELVKRLQAIFRRKSLQPMYVYPDAEGTQHYSRTKPDINAVRGHVVDYFVDLSWKTETRNFGAAYQKDVLPKVRLAGQCQFASSVKPLAASIDSANFTPTIYRIINELRSQTTNPEVDPIFRWALMRELLELAAEGSQPIKIAFEGVLQSETSQLEALSDKVASANWIAPGVDDAELVSLRAATRGELANVGDWDERVKRMSGLFRDFHSPRRQFPKWIGWVAIQNGNHVALLAESAQAEDLFVLGYDASSGQTTRESIKAGDDGALIVATAAGQQAGAMVFLREATAPRSGS